jgi:hypothetical protein
MFRPQGGLAMILTQEQAFLKAEKQLHKLGTQLGNFAFEADAV